MNTDITDTQVAPRFEGWLLYDGDCSLCVRLARRFTGILGRHHFGLAPLQAPWVRARLGLAPGSPLDEMVLLTTDGRGRGGADAVLEIANRIWWARPLSALAHLPGGRRLCRRLYRWFAARRHCLGGECRLGRPNTTGDWLPLLVLPVVVFWWRKHLPAWALMWALAGSIYSGCKWLTWRRVSRRRNGGGLSRTLSYLLAWPGMDASRLFDRYRAVAKPTLRDWSVTMTAILLGSALTWGVARYALQQAPLLAGWLGMIGCVFLLHFGLFGLASLTWRSLGVDAQPIMRAPARSTSAGEFWGRRWNVAFHQLVHDFVFLPLRKRWSVVAATWSAFLVSGLIHDVVISLPAGGGYGLPTAYFLLQGGGVLFERTLFASRLGLGRGRRGWVFTMMLTAGPAFWLFHPEFIRTVILPMLKIVGAT